MLRTEAEAAGGWSPARFVGGCDLVDDALRLVVAQR